MRDLETLHGDEEAIERSSDAFYEVLANHSSGVYGEINWDAARLDIEQVRRELEVQGISPEEAGQGLIYAEETIKNRDIQLSYMD